MLHSTSRTASVRLDSGSLEGLQVNGIETRRCAPPLWRCAVPTGGSTLAADALLRAAEMRPKSAQTTCGHPPHAVLYGHTGLNRYPLNGLAFTPVSGLVAFGHAYRLRSPSRRCRSWRLSLATVGSLRILGRSVRLWPGSCLCVLTSEGGPRRTRWDEAWPSSRPVVSQFDGCPVTGVPGLMEAVGLKAERSDQRSRTLQVGRRRVGPRAYSRCRGRCGPIGAPMSMPDVARAPAGVGYIITRSTGNGPSAYLRRGVSCRRVDVARAIRPSPASATALREEPAGDWPRQRYGGGNTG